MNKKVVALIIAIIIVGVISGLIYVMNKQDENGNETNNLGSTNNAELTNDLIFIFFLCYFISSNIEIAYCNFMLYLICFPLFSFYN